MRVSIAELFWCVEDDLKEPVMVVWQYISWGYRKMCQEDEKEVKPTQ
jgi:hypothetical protein